MKPFRYGQSFVDRKTGNSVRARAYVKPAKMEDGAAADKPTTCFFGYWNKGRTVCEKPGHSYAPALFSQEPEAKAAGLSKVALGDAMRRLFASKKIHTPSAHRRRADEGWHHQRRHRRLLPEPFLCRAGTRHASNAPPNLRAATQ
jgi:hypothetical protein